MTEQARLDRWERRTEWPLAGIAVIFLAAYSIRVLAHTHGIATHAIDALAITSWTVFAADYAVRLWLAPNRLQWFMRHLLDLVIVALPLLQPLRLVRLVIAGVAMQKALGDDVHGRVTFFAVSSAALVVYAASLAELQAERHDVHATINSFGKALFWSITTVTTVGYGFEHPTTATGRTIAALLMISGISLVGTVTATVASWIVHQVGAGGAASPGASDAHINQLRHEVQGLRVQLSEAGAIPSPIPPPTAKPPKLPRGH